MNKQNEKIRKHLEYAEVIGVNISASPSPAYVEVYCSGRYLDSVRVDDMDGWIQGFSTAVYKKGG
jgi:hypothetical protein